VIALKAKFIFENGVYVEESPRDGTPVHVLAYLYNLIYQIETNAMVYIEDENDQDTFAEENLHNVKSIVFEFEEQDRFTKD
jgi:hypothetical protein